MTLFEMWELVSYIANKDYEGNVVTPDNFNRLIKVANLDLLKIKMGLPEDLMPGQPLTRQHLDANKVMTDDTRFLKTRAVNASLSSGVWSYPAGYLTIDTLRHTVSKTINGAPTDIIRMIELITEDRLSDRLGRWVKRPTTWDAVGVIRNDGIHIYPTTGITKAEVIYIRYPKTPNFDYVLGEGFVTEGALTTTPAPGVINEFEWGESLHNDLARLVLSYIGINIRDQMLLGYAEQKKQEGV